MTSSLATCCCPPLGHTPECPRHGLKASAEKRASPRKAPTRKAVRSVSFKQTYRNGFLNGVKAERLSQMAHRPRSALGVSLPLFFCEADCGWGTDDLEVAKGMHLHHAETQRSMGARATPETWGVDDPGSLLLLCPKCHDEVHAPLDAPRWTNKEAG